MKSYIKIKPRVFTVGNNNQFAIKDYGSIHLNPDEQISFLDNENCEYDVTKKDWGFYATPSINGRLVKFNYKSALVINRKKMVYLMLCKIGKENEFKNYLATEGQQIICWLNDQKSIAKIAKLFDLEDV